MISYPGEILRRFGRYEAIEDLGPQEKGHLWRAWDPYLERFVLVASMPNLDAAQVFRQSQDVQVLFEGEFGAAFAHGRTLLDFGPAARTVPAYFILSTEAPRVEASAPARDLVSETTAKAPPKLALRGAAILAIVAAFALGAVTGSQFGGGSADERVARDPDGERVAPTAAIAAEPVIAVPTAKAADVKAPAADAPPTSAPATIGLGAPGAERRAVVAFSRVDPPAGSTRLTSGESRQFSAEVENSDAPVFAWRLDGTPVSSERSFLLKTGFGDRPGVRSLQLTVTDPASGVAVDASWTVEIDSRNSPPEVKLTLPARAIQAGKTLVVGAEVKDADLGRGDRTSCAWTVDGQPRGENCRRLEWRVPPDASPGPRLVSLTASDSTGASKKAEIEILIEAAVNPTVKEAAARSASTPTRTARTISSETPPGRAAEPASPPPRTPVAPIEAAGGDQSRAILAALTAHQQSQLRAKGIAAKVQFEIVDLQVRGDTAEVRAWRTVELPSQAAQRAEKSYRLTRVNGQWQVLD